ncbi:MAG TPA: hypothetical protein VNO55_10200 [Polyangia bacterium]|nr:hypothetical protein [Polyangia bacterium]
MIGLLLLGSCAVDPSGTSPGTPAGGGGAGGHPATGGTAGASGGAGGARNMEGAGGGNPGTGGGATATNDGATGAGPDGDGTSDSAPATGDQPPSRPLKVDPSTSCKCELGFSATSLDPLAGTSKSDTHAGDAQHMKVDVTKKLQGKLVITLGGIGGGPGTGGIYGYAINRGYHAFMVATQTAISSAPAQYKNVNTPEANRQVADARMEAWDGVDRVDWLEIKPPDSIVNRTQHALKNAMAKDPGGDWGYFLNTDGTVRWSDVIMVGYSFGAQTIAMVSKYVRFSRVLATSGPVDEGFPGAAWITQQRSATPVDRLFMMVGGAADYPPASGNVDIKIDTVLHAGWPMAITNVHPGDLGPFATNPHEIVLVGSGPGAPGGHSEFCAGDGGGWKAICDYGFGVK